ncbi:MAG TPA: hypothetical protein VFZ18_06265 [Longimicrobiaceae bacterium]
MATKTRSMWIAALGAALLGGCDSVLDPGGQEAEGVNFSYSGGAAGSFASAGVVGTGQDGLPALEAFAMAQRDSIGGLLLGSFRKTAEARGDLFILQLRGTEPGTYGCGPGAQGPRCYGHLYIGVNTEQPLSAQEVYAVTSGDVVLSAVGPARLEGTFELTLGALAGAPRTLVVEDGTIDVPLVEGVFNASFRCLAVRLAEGPEAACD